MTTKNATSEKLSDAFKIDKIDQDMLQFITEFPDADIDQISEHVKLSKSEVLKRSKRPIFIRYLNQITETLEETIQRAHKSAAKRLMTLTKSSNDRIALDACKTLLTPLLSKPSLGGKKLAEVIHRSYIGEQGQLIQDIIEIEAQKDEPKKVGESKKEKKEAVQQEDELDVNDLF